MIFMTFELYPDIAGEALQKLKEVLNWIINIKNELAEKDKKIYKY